MDRLLIASELVRGLQKSLICIGLCIGWRAVALMGIRTGPLASLADRLAGNPLGYQAQGASIDLFHAVAQSRTWSRVIGSDGRDLVKMCVEGLLSTQHAPSDTGELIGEGCGQLVAVHPRRCAPEPIAEAVLLPIMRPHQDDVGRLDEERSEIVASSPRDAAQDRSAASA